MGKFLSLGSGFFRLLMPLLFDRSLVTHWPLPEVPRGRVELKRRLKVAKKPLNSSPKSTNARPKNSGMPRNFLVKEGAEGVQIHNRTQSNPDPFIAAALSVAGTRRSKIRFSLVAGTARYSSEIRSWARAKCPGCGFWPMAVNPSKGRIGKGQRFLCANCGHHFFRRSIPRVRPRPANPLGSHRFDIPTSNWDESGHQPKRTSGHF